MVYQPSQVEASIENINRHLEYLGYYGSDVRSDIKVKGRKVTVTYSITLGKRYRIGNVSFAVPDGEFKEDFLADTSATIRPGDYLSEDALEKETERCASAMRRKGYFGFTKNYFSFEADTLNSPDTAGLLMMVKEYTRNQTPEYARRTGNIPWAKSPSPTTKT